ncbi:hypothetical protein CEQ11_010195 [Micrococcus sp. FDAARGOS_333]|nr:hypothetical protein CEQ11_010195 [Micrococcus sp. FDAARGOS_333]
MESGGTSLVTTDPAAMIARVPMRTPGGIATANDEHEPAIPEHSGEHAELGHRDVALSTRSQMGRLRDSCRRDDARRDA